jgi:hypothetical protein
MATIVGFEAAAATGVAVFLGPFSKHEQVRNLLLVVDQLDGHTDSIDEITGTIDPVTGELTTVAGVITESWRATKARVYLALFDQPLDDPTSLSAFLLGAQICGPSETSSGERFVLLSLPFSQPVPLSVDFGRFRYLGVFVVDAEASKVLSGFVAVDSKVHAAS